MIRLLSAADSGTRKAQFLQPTNYKAVPLRGNSMLGTSATTRRISDTLHELPVLPGSFVLFAFLIGLILRIAAARGELWLDEIWSLELAQQAKSPWSILTDLRLDNNHALNTLYLWLLGPGFPNFAYRFAAVLTGALSVPLAGLIARRWGTIESVSTMTLFATSYLMVHYSSEARGYGFVIFFALAGFESLLRYLENGNSRWVVAFTCCSIGGFLSHPVFTQFSLAMALGMVWVLRNSTHSWPQTVTKTAVGHAPSFLLAVMVYKFHWSQFELGGGPEYHLISIISEAFSLTLGGPSYGSGAVVVAIPCVVGIGWGLWAMSRRRADAAPLVTLGILIPLTQVIAIQPPFLFVRYFLVAIVFGIFALAMALGELHRRGPKGRWAYACLLCGLLAANTWHTVELVRLGRGNCRSALDFIAKTTVSPRITISSDHDFGISKLVHFHGARLRAAPHFEYIPGQAWPPSGPQWLVLHRDAEDTPAAVEQHLTIEGHSFELAKVFDCAPLSGWRWLCYRRVP